MEAAARERRFRNVEEDAARLDRARFELGAKNAALQDRIVGLQGPDSIQLILALVLPAWDPNFFSSNAAPKLPQVPLCRILCHMSADISKKSVAVLLSYSQSYSGREFTQPTRNHLQ